MIVKRQSAQEEGKPLIIQYREQRIYVLNKLKELKENEVSADNAEVHVFNFNFQGRNFEKGFTTKQLKRKYVENIIIENDEIIVEYRPKQSKVENVTLAIA